MKISDLYPEDTNAMQISFVVPRAGWDGVGGPSEPPAAAGGTGSDGRAAVETPDPQVPVFGTLLPELEQIPTWPGTVRWGASPAGTPPELSPTCHGVPLPVFCPLRAPHRFQVEETVLDKLKITFENSTDFFGRIVVYHLGVLGQRL